MRFFFIIVEWTRVTETHEKMRLVLEDKSALLREHQRMPFSKEFLRIITDEVNSIPLRDL